MREEGERGGREIVLVQSRPFRLTDLLSGGSPRYPSHTELHEPSILHPLLIQVLCQTMAAKVDSIQYYVTHVVLGIRHLGMGM